MTIEEITKYLRKNRKLLKINHIAERLNMDSSNLSKMIKGEADSHGTVNKIPEKYLPELKKIIKELQLNKLK